MTTMQYVPLISIIINRGGEVDALDLFRETGLAVLFTAGEVAMIAEENGGKLDGVLREPEAGELPTPLVNQDTPVAMAPSDDPALPCSIDDLNAIAEANLAAIKRLA